MNISAASRATGLSEKAIRRYESDGLLPGVQRRPNAYRDYSDADIIRLHFIRRTRELDFPIVMIRALLQLRDDSARKASDVRALVLQHLASIERKAEVLRTSVERLTGLVNACDGCDLPDCVILTRLSNGIGIDIVSSPEHSRDEASAVMAPA
jgi:DNA-binding transcriptional MerR regulator